MTIVIADTSPINYLIPIGEIEILPRLYHRIVIPEEVFSELMDEGAPPEVREWTTQYPRCLEIRRAASHDPSLMDLDAGEGCAIALAEFESDVLLLIDETAGRLEASRRGIPNTGTLGVLRAAAIDNLVDLPFLESRWQPRIFGSQRLWLPVFLMRTLTGNSEATESFPQRLYPPGGILRNVEPSCRSFSEPRIWSETPDCRRESCSRQLP